MKITQAVVSNGVQFFKPVFDHRFGLTIVDRDTYDINTPAVFVGMYDTDDIRKFINHKSHARVLWCGSDAQRADIIRTLTLKDDVSHISISWYIDYMLRALGITPKYVPLPMTLPEDWESCVLGNKMYCYAPNEVYGRSLAEQVAKSVPYELIMMDGTRSLTKQELKDVYKQCFIGLRLREFDGVAASVQELGMMGRRTVWNGKTPSAIGWNSLDDVISIVTKEAEKIGTEQPAVANSVNSWICADDSWLEV